MVIQDSKFPHSPVQDNADIYSVHASRVMKQSPSLPLFPTDPPPPLPDPLGLTLNSVKPMRSTSEERAGDSRVFSGRFLLSDSDHHSRILHRR